MNAHADLLAGFLKEGPLEEGLILTPDPKDPWWKDREIVSAIGGSLSAAGHRVSLKVGLCAAFPLCLPEVAVAAITPAIELPHVDEDGKLCFESSDGLLLDRRDPLGVLSEAFSLALKALERAIRGPRTSEFAQEIVAHWLRLRPAARASVDCVVTAGEEARPITAIFRKSQFEAVADSPGLYDQSQASRRAAGVTHRNAIYIPISPARMEDFVPRDLLQLETLRRLVADAEPSERKSRQRLLGELSKREETIVLGVERPSGGRALIGVSFRGPGGTHPLLGGQSSTIEVTPEQLTRRDLAFLAPRGGADARLASKRVLLIGCGSVGGHLALALARTGIGNLALVDPQTFELGNTYRHACGMAYVGQGKALGLRREIERLVPYVKVTHFPEEIEAVVARTPGFLREFDLVLCASGNPTVELWLNEHLWSGPLGPPTVFAWLEPLGLGGHLLLTRPSSGEHRQSGCFECLHHRPDPLGPLVNRSAFAAPGANYSRDVLGCGSWHTPFGSVDAERLAISCARVAVDVLRARRKGSFLESWKGDPAEFRAEGFATTDRFAASQAELDAEAEAFARAACQVCAR